MVVKYPEIHDILPFVLVPELYEEWLERAVSADERRRMLILEQETSGPSDSWP
jgi:putative SOS response-associated peptidase YedK